MAYLATYVQFYLMEHINWNGFCVRHTSFALHK